MSLVMLPAIQKGEVRQKIAEGDAGAYQTLTAMRGIIEDYPCRAQFRALAQRRTVNMTSDTAKIGAIDSWAREAIHYVQDPDGMEQVKSPCRILREISERGVAADDCDGYAVFIAAAARELGMKTALMAVSNKKLNEGTPESKINLDHVFAVIWNHDLNKWQSVDPVAPGKDWKGHKHMTLLISDHSFVNDITKWITGLFLFQGASKGVHA